MDDSFVRLCSEDVRRVDSEAFHVGGALLEGVFQTWQRLKFVEVDPSDNIVAWGRRIECRSYEAFSQHLVSN